MAWEEFWDLTWYDWNGWLGRITIMHKRRELDLELQRTQMAWMVNVHGNKTQPQDILTLSYDKRLPKKDEPEFKKGDMMQAMEKRFTKRKKNGK